MKNLFKLELSDIGLFTLRPLQSCRSPIRLQVKIFRARSIVPDNKEKRRVNANEGKKIGKCAN